MEGRFCYGFCIRFAGSSNCGKTWTLLKLLQLKDHFSPCPPKRVMWVSGSGVQNDHVENTVKELYPNSQFFYNLFDMEDFADKVQEYDFWVFDDLSSELRNSLEFTNFFTKIAHHKKCIMAYLTQNLYEPGRDAATRTRNCAYQVYFKSKADKRWISILGNQLVGNQKKFEALFDDATQDAYDCLLCDNRPANPDIEQFIGKPFSPTEDKPTCFYVPHK